MGSASNQVLMLEKDGLLIIYDEDAAAVGDG
jgi:hypothetical protein